MPSKQPQFSLATPLIAGPLRLCRRVWSSIGRRAQIVLQRALSRKPRLDPDRLPVAGANLRCNTAPILAQAEQLKPTPIAAVRDHVLRLVRPGHAEFGKDLLRDRATAAGPHPPSKPRPDSAEGASDTAPNAKNKR
jgi:hypothetical protein